MVASCPHEVVIATPDHDVYCENMGPNSADIVAVKFADERRPSPPSVAGQVYRFRAVTTPARLSIYLQLAAPAADEVFREKHPNQALPSGGAFISLAQHQASRRAVSTTAGSPAGYSSDTKVWVAVETTAAFK